MKFGILDFGLADKRTRQDQRIHDTIASAQVAEALGSTRYWLGEHYPTAAPWGYPLATIKNILQQTTRIRIGSGGVMLFDCTRYVALQGEQSRTLTS